MAVAKKKKKPAVLQCKAKMQKLGAWTIAILPLDMRKELGRGGHIRIKGTIDGFPFDDSSLMPMRTGAHCLPVRTEIRKAIRKQAGSTIELVFEEDHAKPVIPVELMEAFEASPEALKLFESYSPSHKRNYTRYINDSKNPETRVKRAVKAVLSLEKIYFEQGIKEKKKK